MAIITVSSVYVSNDLFKSNKFKSWISMFGRSVNINYQLYWSMMTVSESTLLSKGERKKLEKISPESNTHHVAPRISITSGKYRASREQYSKKDMFD